jgi:serine/threonine protein kinase
MAEVHLARAHGTAAIDRLVAVKLVTSHMADDASFVAMLQQEARIATSLDHPNIAALLDFGWSEGEPYLVTEYVHGWPLQEVLRAAANAGAALPMGCAVGIVRAVAEALHYAHEARDVEGRPLGIVHRDVSPSNVLVRYDGVIKVVDFGIAKATRLPVATETGTLKGKRGYMSPEQCNGLELDRRSDVFCLGILLFEVTTGYRLFSGHNDFAVMNRIVKGEIVSPSQVQADYPAELERIVLRALAVKPGDRQPDAATVQRELEAFAREERLDTSSLQLQAFLDRVMGPRPHPALELEGTTPSSPPSGDTQVVGTGSTAQRARRRRWQRLAFVASTIVGVTLTVVVAHALTRTPAAVDRPTAPASAPVVIEDPVAAPRSIAQPIVDDVPLDEVVPAKEETPPRRSAPRTKSTRRAKPAASVPESPRRPRRTLFPDADTP